MKINAFIVDYNSGNLHSVKSAINSLNIKTLVSSNPNDMKKYDAIILPGVGSFKRAIENLKKKKLFDEIINLSEKQKPILGICLGFQLLFSRSNEFGINDGLNLIQGDVKKLESNVKLPDKVPNIGWKKIEMCNEWKNSPLKDNSNNNLMYFIHSYYAIPKNKKIITSLSYHNNISFCSSVCSKNIFATQFHPEKSSTEGLKIYSNFFKFYF